MKPIKYLALLAILVLTSGCVNAQEGGERGKILFYEIGSSADYGSSTGYSEFADQLKKRGYNIAALVGGEITGEKLQYYDVLIIPNMNASLTPDEMATVLSFVIRDGKGVFITVGSPSATNQLTILFGIRVDSSGKLIDVENQLIGDDSKYHFAITRFSDDPTIRTIRQGINQLGFYGGSGLYLTGNAKFAAAASRSTYSTTGTFPLGSIPPVVAASRLGDGSIFVGSDPDMFKNENIERYDNMRFATNVIEWLEPTCCIPENKTPNDMVRELTIEKNRLNRENEILDAEKTMLQEPVNALDDQIGKLDEGVDTCHGAMQYNYVAIGAICASIIIFGICVLLAAIIYSSRKK
ncbi:MAG: hypothetical protein MSIBF_00585 [Candidatus Altiarchaeales archaeon IMC4]|nr:MAG: hypothetical protein MSIBF_00585 [Candidatus Altiarchaeales archaeon IMC4]